LWLAYGRDKRLVRPIEFYPPDALPSGEVGYLIDGKVDDRDLFSLILWWASQGYLTIEEKQTGKFTIRKQAELPHTLRPYQHEFFGGLFPEGTEERELGAPDEDLAWRMKTARKMLKQDYAQDVRTKLYTRSSIACQMVGLVLLFVPVVFYYAAVADTPEFLGGGGQ
jgi:hypothetical protein